EIGANGLKLRLPAQAGRAHSRFLRQILNLRIKPRAESVAGVFTFRDGGDLKSRSKLGGQVLQRMHGEINTSGGEGLLDFFRENSLAKSALRADLGQGDVGDLVAGSVNDFDLNFVAACPQQSGDVVGLPESKLRAARADAETRHQRCDSAFLPVASLPLACDAGPVSLSCRLNSRRTTSMTVVASASRAAV